MVHFMDQRLMSLLLVLCLPYFFVHWLILCADALGRHHQCGTIQLDFQLPKKFCLEYTSADGSRQTPVIIHRAILGSLERFMALLLENTGGFLPFGVAPRHVAVLPVSVAHAVYAQHVVDELQRTCPDAHVEVMDAISSSLGKRVRECIKTRVSMIWTVGDNEVASRSISMRWSKSSDTKVFFQMIAPSQQCLAKTPQSSSDPFLPQQVFQLSDACNYVSEQLRLPLPTIVTGRLDTDKIGSSTHASICNNQEVKK
jgi:hypothetical protein